MEHYHCCIIIVICRDIEPFPPINIAAVRRRPELPILQPGQGKRKKKIPWSAALCDTEPQPHHRSEMAYARANRRKINSANRTQVRTLNNDVWQSG